MKKAIKITAVVVVLIIATLIALPFLFKDRIIEQVKIEANKNLNAEIDFGDFDLSLIRSFPNFYFSIQDVKVDGKDDFEGIPLAQIGELALTVDVMSIIKGETIAVKKVKIDEANLYAKVLANGKANWDIVKSDSTEIEGDVSDSTSSFQLNLQKLEILNSNIIYEDATFPMMAEMGNINLNLNGDFTADVTTLDLKGEIEQITVDYDGIKYLNQVKLNTDMAIEADLLNSKYTLNDADISLNALNLAINGWLSNLEDSQEMDLTFALKETSLKSIISLIPAEFAKDLDGIKTEGDVKLSAFVKGVYKGESYPAFGLDLNVDKGKFSYSDLPESVNDISIDAKVSSKGGDIDNTIIDVNQFHFSMANNPFDLSAHVENPTTDPLMNVKAKGKIILDNVKQMIPLEKEEAISGIINMDIALNGRVSSLENEQYEKFDAKGMIVIDNLVYKTNSTDYPIQVKKADLTFDPQTANLKQLDIILGQSDIAMNGSLSNFLGYALSDNQTLKGTINLNSKKLNLTELSGGEETATETETAADSAPMETLLIPKYIDMTMNVNVGQMIYDDIDMRNFKGSVGVQNQRLNMSNLGMDILDGQIKLDGFYETTDTLKPTFAVIIDANQLDVTKTITTFSSLEKMMPIAKKAVGKYATEVKVNGALDAQMNPIIESINGKGTLTTDNVEIKGFKGLEKIAEVLKYDRLKEMKLDDVFFTFNIVSGVVFVEPFDVKLGDSKVTIAGSNKLDQTIDYTLSFAIPRKELGGQANQVIDKAIGQINQKGANVSIGEVINIDVKMVGTITDPKITTDYKKAASNAVNEVKDQIKDEINKKKEELEQKAREEAERLKKEAEEKAKAEAERLKKEAEERAKKEAEKLKEQGKDKLKDFLNKKK